MYLRELHVRYRKRRLPRHCPIPVGLRISTPRECAPVLINLLEQEPVEVLVGLYLSTRHELLCFHELGRGSLDAAVVHPRDVFKGAFLANAAAIILGHNHPSGDPSPSRDDLALTRRLMTAGDLMGVEVLDHIVVGFDGRYSSMKELGRL